MQLVELQQGYKLFTVDRNVIGRRIRKQLHIKLNKNKFTCSLRNCREASPRRMMASSAKASATEAAALKQFGKTQCCGSLNIYCGSGSSFEFS